jgi:nitrous oxide reductase accessory protein NosL
MYKFKYLLIALLTLSFLGCDKQDTNGPHKIHYDRDMCSECKMVISDRNYAVQIVNPVKNKAYNFDDIGCAIIWMDQNNEEWLDNAKMFIADQKTSELIPSREVYWAKGFTTPMDFGFAAFKDKPTEKVYDFIEVYQDVMASKNAKKAMKCGSGKCGAGKCGSK